MGDQELTELDVWNCFKIVKRLIKDLPKETFIGDSDLAKKKEKADAVLPLLEIFFKTLPDINQNEIDELARIAVKLKELKGPYKYACGNLATISPPVPGEDNG
jgi:hypothetical protein